ncbi:hypothetical protein [Gracilimonas sediminicola]|uniref:hypothetical protein n=1 Tax=Gracilimonas sediminicola TaxID=2952158 RepID=UPI0038D41102
MSKSAKDIARFRKNLKQFIKLKSAGKLNGQAAAIEEKLTETAGLIGLDFQEESQKAAPETTRKNPGMDKNNEEGALKKEKDEARENPVEVPFSLTLEELDNLHSIRSVRKLNSYVGFQHPCYAKRHSGVSEKAHISFHYDPDYRNKVYTLKLLLDGQVEYTACAKGEKANFKAAWKEILKKYSDLEIVIEKQDHAKKVLGAKEYKRQEKEFENSKKTPTKKSNKKSGYNKSAKSKSQKPSTKKSKDDSGNNESRNSQTGEIDLEEASEQLEEAKSVFQMLKEKYG